MCSLLNTRPRICRYGGEHKEPELQKQAVYGLTELYRDQIKAARLVANPGCYPTSVQLPLAPLLQVCLAPATECCLSDIWLHDTCMQPARGQCLQHCPGPCCFAAELMQAEQSWMPA